MKYSMQVVILNPKAEGMDSDMFLNLKCYFSHDPETYGNGYYLHIVGDGMEKSYDLRYNTDFRSNRKISFITQWAENYWNGENGAYILKSISVKRLDGDTE